MDEGRLALGREDPPLLLVEAHVGVEPGTQESHHLMTHRWSMG